MLAKPASPRGPVVPSANPMRFQEGDGPWVALLVKPVSMSASKTSGEALATPVKRLDPYATPPQLEI